MHMITNRVHKSELGCSFTKEPNLQCKIEHDIQGKHSSDKQSKGVFRVSFETCVHLSFGEKGLYRNQMLYLIFYLIRIRNGESGGEWTQSLMTILPQKYLSNTSPGVTVDMTLREPLSGLLHLENWT